jgi:hypothetical protein
VGLQPFITPYVVVVIDVEPIRERFSTVAPFLDERAVGWSRWRRRLLWALVALPRWPWRPSWREHDRAGSEAISAGRTIAAGSAAGRKPAIIKDPTLVADLEALVEPTTRGDPESPLRWTCKSV